ncbi:MAG TPA: aspartate aminotransferase family protein [Opitutaceae bacterium]|nr:aspartate aminotransferase family protein [Opitutaceae bacterium]
MTVPSIVRTNTAELYDAYVMKNFPRAPLTLVRGQGVRVWDDTGKEYLDFASGIAVNALGHCHPAWVEAIRRQAGELIHVSNLYRNPNYGELARRIVQHAGPGRVFLCNSGTEANEALIKLARLHGVRKSGEEGKCFKIICAKNAFHGRTYGGMSATPQEKIQKGFRPLVPGFAFGEINNLQSFVDLVDEHTAAIFLETVQGEGGVTPCTDEFLWGLRQLCDRHNLLLMLDEVQCGFGRTGTFFAFQHSGVRADAIGMAKGIANGYPMGAIWVTEKHGELFTPGSHGTTFGGSPLACAASLAVLDVIERENLLQKVSVNGAAWKAKLEKLAADFPRQVKAVTGRGYMLGVMLHVDPVPYLAALRERGFLCPSAGGNTIRLLPPLIATADDLNRAADLIRAVLEARDKL